jgi:PAT family beta-lactamase induction signal transducer AmpG
VSSAPPPVVSTAKPSWIESIGIYKHPRVIAMLFLGFAAGLPFLLVFSTLSTWLRESGVSRTEIGFFSWIGLTYSLKFFWAPFVDRLKLPLLHRWLGRRRSWMLLAQFGIVAGLLGMAFCEPRTETVTVALLALLVAFSSATQDVALDAYRIEAVHNDLQGAMAAMYQLGYKVAILTSGAGALYIAEFVDWSSAYKTMAVCGLVGIVATLIVAEPKTTTSAQTVAREQRVLDYAGRLGPMPQWLKDMLVWLYGGVVCPFADFFRRNGLFAAITILLFISVFRISDITMGVMAGPFYIDLGFTKDQIADIAKIYGFVLAILGTLFGGILVFRIGAVNLLAITVVLTAGTNLFFAWLAASGRPDTILLTLTISADNFASGMAGSVFIAYLSSLTNTAYTATQYALFSSFMTLAGKLIGGFSGLAVDQLQIAINDGASWASLIPSFLVAPERFGGYFVFFVYTAALGIPAFILSFAMMYIDARQKRSQEIEAAPA